MADFFHLFRYNTVAGDMGDIPSVPDEAANGEHRDSVTHCVTKSRRSSGWKRPLLVSSWRQLGLSSRFGSAVVWLSVRLVCPSGCCPRKSNLSAEKGDKEKTRRVNALGFLMRCPSCSEGQLKVLRQRTHPDKNLRGQSRCCIRHAFSTGLISVKGKQYSTSLANCLYNKALLGFG
jgi:hypothetical protein